MKLKLGKYYLIRQNWHYGSDHQDNIMVLKYVKKASKSDDIDYGGDNGYWGENVKDDDNDSYYFEYKDVISSIKI